MRFVIRFVILLCIILSGNAYATDFEELSLESLEQKLTTGKDPKFTYIFTSWCGVCKRSFADLIKLHTTYGLPDKVTFLAISLDTDPAHLDKFVKAFRPNFPVYRLYYKDSISAQETLSRLGIAFKQRVPYANFRDEEQNILLDESFRYASSEAVLQYSLSKP